MITHSIDTIVNWLQLHPHWGGVVTFIISALESVAIVGTIVPGAVMMVGIGALIGTGILPFWSTLLYGIVGAIVGDGLSYFLGYRYNDHLRNMWPFKTSPNLLSNGEVFFARHGGKSVFIGRFIGPMRAIVPVVAGMLKMSHTRFFVANVASGIVWAPAHMLPGFLLGVASLQFPPHIAMYYILLFLGACIAFILTWWIIKQCYLKIEDNIAAILAKLWIYCQRSPRQHPLTQLLQHHNRIEQHGQLATFLMLCCISVLFLMLVFFILIQGEHNPLNELLYHIARNLHSPLLTHFFVFVTYLGEKKILYPAGIILFFTFILCKQWRLAWHWLALLVIAGVAMLSIKFLVQAPRPPGVLLQYTGFSFPSGHATFSIAFYGFLAKLTVDHYQRRFRKLIYWCAAIIIIFVSLSRLYLTAHWFTDVVGGLLLGTICLLIVNIAFLRLPAKPFFPARTFAVFFSSILLLGSYFTHKHYEENVINAALVWPKSTFDFEQWWSANGENAHNLRPHAFGLPGKYINVQWAGELATIKSSLLSQGWKITQPVDWKNIIHPVRLTTEIQRSPLVLKKFQGKPPALILTNNQGGNGPILLTLWESDTTLTPGKVPLWMAHIGLLHKEHNDLTPPIEFPGTVLQPYLSNRFVWKFCKDKKMILIKPEE